MINTLIVEDEPYIREGLKTLLKNITDELNIVGECESVNDALTHCRNEMPELVFLDINLKGGTGFDFLNELGDVPFKVIFITAYEEHVLRALRLGAIDYVLKPVNENELNEAVQRAMLISKTNNKERLEVVENQFIGKNDRIVLRMSEGYQIVNFDSLMFCKADGGYTTFFCDDDRTFIVSKPLKEFTSQLPEDIFFRVHQSYLVNAAFVDRYDKTRYLYLKKGQKIPVSVRKKDSVISKIFGGL